MKLHVLYCCQTQRSEQWTLLSDALEFSLKGVGKEWLWCVDPIDGTTNFASGLPVSGYSLNFLLKKLPELISIFSNAQLCVVSIGVAYKEQVVVGLVYNPVLEDMYTAIRGQGAFCNGARIRVAEGEINEAVINCGCKKDTFSANHFPTSTFSFI